MQNPERQIQLARQLVDSTTEGDPRRAEYLSKLGTALGVHFEHIGRIQDLEEAISVTRQASDLVQEDHPDRTSWLNSVNGNAPESYRGQSVDEKSLFYQL